MFSICLILQFRLALFAYSSVFINILPSTSSICYTIHQMKYGVDFPQKKETAAPRRFFFCGSLVIKS
jgi:hypothetical protein